MSRTAAEVQLSNITMAYGRKTVLKNLDLKLEGGELLALLGPSGCGKTTILRVLAGFESPQEGAVSIAGRDVTMDAVRTRGIGVVFQAYSLFPHMTARDNVAYGLRIRGTSISRRTARAAELLETVGLAEHAEKFPHQLSGGQQQRVALARALAIEPRVLLLDEPLSALDAKVRVHLREEIRRVQTQAGTTTLLVTHDQEEALTTADRIGVMYDGRIEQLDAPEVIYRRPATAFVSEFVGVTNRIPAVPDGRRVLVLGRQLSITNPETAGGSAALVALIRPEDLAVSDDSTGASLVTSLVLRGAITSVNVQSQDDVGQTLRIDVPAHEAMKFTAGQRVAVSALRDTTLVGHARTALKEEDAA
ncbi:ABC transporter ATP-binding protein [Pseudarthrobacter sp. Y6]|uniref:ABC transporter ATP-binding protein n=1 Tax=Pseudarthrobacter sp. Y6 TaxID=3418422 RepID=UPI003CEA9DE3